MKIIGSDYDGTLNHNGIDDVKKLAIEKWRGKGNIFALITGRGKESALEIYEAKRFGCDYLIADNGAVIMKPDGTVVSETRCDASVVKPLLELIFKLGCPWGHVHSDISFRVYADPAECEDPDEFSIENMPEISYITQLSACCPTVEEAAEVTQGIRERFGNVLNPLQNGVCIDIVRADMNKAKGLYILMDILGADYDDVIAVGDNINDRDMIMEFRSYAMENGVDEIKNLADFVTEGITELIEKELSEA